MKRICLHCKKVIKPKEDYARLVSYSKGKISHEDSWHRRCWKITWEEKMDKRIKEYANNILNQAQPMLSKLMNGEGLYA